MNETHEEPDQTTEERARLNGHHPMKDIKVVHREGLEIATEVFAIIEAVVVALLVTYTHVASQQTVSGPTDATTHLHGRHLPASR